MDRSLTVTILDEILSLGVGTQFTSVEIRNRLNEKGLTVETKNMVAVVRRYNGVYFRKVKRRTHNGNIYVVTRSKRVR